MEPAVEESKLVQHANHEMYLAGLYDTDADYNGAIPGAVQRVVQVFAADEHSGGSAAMVLAILDKVLRFEPLTPLTSDPEEWRNVSETAGYPFWQNKRDTRMFSEDGGKTWYNVEEKEAG